MRITKTRIGFAVFICGLLTAVLLKGWLWYGQLTERIYAGVQQQVGVELNAERVQYDPVSKKLLLDTVTVSAPGLDISAPALELGITAPWWLGIGRKAFPTAIEYSRFSHASLWVTAPESLIPLTRLGHVFFRNGVIYPGQESRPLSFSFLGFSPEPEGSAVKIEALGVNGLSWSFNGAQNLEDDVISGVLKFEQQEISQFLSDTGYSGRFDASMDFLWDGSRSLRLSGDIRGGAGSYQSGDFRFQWDSWQFPDGEFTDWNVADSSQLLEFNETRLQLSGTRISPFVDWVKALPVAVSGLAANQLLISSRQEYFKDAILDHVQLTLQGNRQYQFMARVASGGSLLLNGDAGGTYQLVFEDVAPQVLGLLSTTRQLGFADRHYNFAYNKSTGVGRLSFWQQKALDNYSLIEKLLFDVNGQAELLFSNKGINLHELRAETGRQLTDKLEVIQNSPFTYLSGITEQPFQPYLEHIPGKPDLTASSEKNLSALKAASKLRPGLKWQLETGVAISEDWPHIARSAFEQTLAKLHPDDEQGLPPEEVREKLIEQLYLVTQKQKIPEVGLVTREERIQQAEQWLIESWPENPELINQLLKERKELLDRKLRQNGLDNVTVLSGRQEHNQPRSLLSIK